MLHQRFSWSSMILLEIVAILARLRAEQIGEIGGIAFSDNDRLLVFHRANRIWSEMQTERPQPIAKNVVAVFRPNSSEKIEFHWGSNRFLMPHGIEVDRNNNVWLTDALTDSIFKFTLKGHRLLRVRGFCGPTDLSIVKNDADNLFGDVIYVADGYCRQRIVKLNIRTGQTIQSIGIPFVDNDKDVVHSITAYKSSISDLVTICVAIRNDGSVICVWDYGEGFDRRAVYVKPNSEIVESAYAVRFVNDDDDNPAVLVLTTGGLWTISDRCIQAGLGDNPEKRLLASNKIYLKLNNVHCMAVRNGDGQLFVGTTGKSSNVFLVK